jgi:hypothetical protein
LTSELWVRLVLLIHSLVFDVEHLLVLPLLLLLLILPIVASSHVSAASLLFALILFFQPLAVVII